MYCKITGNAVCALLKTIVEVHDHFRSGRGIDSQYHVFPPRTLIRASTRRDVVSTSLEM